MTSLRGVPDMLANRQMAAWQNQLKRDLMRVQEEATTGVRADRVDAASGDTSRIMAIERSIFEIEARAPLLDLASARAAATQTALGAVQADLSRVAVNLQDVTTTATSAGRAVRGQEADAKLREVVSALNTQFGGRYLFSGADTDSPALAAADTLIARVRDAIDTAPPGDVAAALAAVDDFFGAVGSPPGVTFESEILRFDVSLTAPDVELVDGERVSYAVRADQESLRDVMKALAIAAAVNDSTLGADPGAVVEIFAASGAMLLTADTRLVDERARVGAVEERISAAHTSQQAMRSTLIIARNAIIGRDPYEAATELKDVENRLNTLYAITTRVASLSLLNFFR